MKYRFIVLIFLFFGLSYAHRFALLVGNNEGGSNLTKLKYVKNDISSLQSILKDFCGFSDKNITILYNKTPQELKKSIDSIGSMVTDSEEDLFLFYYSGHADHESLKMGDAQLPLMTLKNLFSSFPATVRIGIFDACQSGSFTRLKGGQLAEPFLFKNDGKIQGQVILSSSSPTENAQESDHLGNSVFTFHLVNALRGSGDISGDGKVTLSEAYHYSYNHTVSTTARSWGGVQHPSYQFRIQGEGDIVLADLNTRSEGILLENALSGHITIVDKKNNIVADLMKDSNNNMMIALNPGIYKVYNVKGKRHFEASAKVQSKGLSTVAHSHFRPIKPHAVTHKGAERFNFRPVIGVTGGYMHVNVSLLEKALKKQFSSFNHFNIAPSFSYNSNVYGAISGQIQLPNGLEGTMDIGATTLSGKHRTYNGVRNNKQNNRNYNYVLSISDDMELVLLSVSAGYRFRSGVLKNALIHAGATSYNVKHTTKTSFDDTQFDITIDNEYSITGNAVVPFIGIGYALPLWRFGEIRSIARYRHQHKPKHFTDERNGISLPFDFSGIDFMMHVQYYLIR